MEIEQSKLTKAECIEILAKYTRSKTATVEAIIGLLIKIGVLHEFVFKEEKK